MFLRNPMDEWDIRLITDTDIIYAALSQQHHKHISILYPLCAE